MAKRQGKKLKKAGLVSSGLPMSIKMVVLGIVVVACLAQLVWFYRSSNQIIPESKLPYIRGWGSVGNKLGCFDEPRDVACDAEGNVYVADTKNCRIQKFNSDGVLLKSWGSKGTKDGQFQGPCSVTVNNANNVMVVDWVDNRVQTFSKDGVFISKFQGGFYGPISITTDKASNIWVSNAGGPNIHKFNSHGDVLNVFGQNGRKKGQMVDPSGIAVDENMDFYVVDSGNQRIEKFNSGGRFLKMWAPPKNVSSNLRKNIIGPKGNLYVVDEASRIWVLTKDLQPIRSITEPQQEKFGALSGMSFDKSGIIYLVNYRESRILKLGPVSDQ